MNKKQMNPGTRVTLLSHAPTSAIRRAAFPLDESIEGSAREKLRAAGWHVTVAQHFLVAPEKRTQETAVALGLSTLIDPMLRDCDYGSWAGRDLNDLQCENAEEVAVWLSDLGAAPHGGETIRDLMVRAADWLSSRRNSGHTVAVTHPSIIRGILVAILEAPPQAFWRIDIAPLTLTDLRLNGRAWTIRSVGISLTKGIAE